MLTQKELKHHLHYNKRTGIFKWRRPTSNCVQKGDVAGCLHNNGYLSIGIKGKEYLLHRLAFLYVKGYFPENHIDHKDRNPLNNRWKNLREVSSRCNRRNSKVYKHNSTGVSGISYNEKQHRWSAYIYINNEQKYLGSFKDFDEAVSYRYAAEQCLNWKGCNSTSSAHLYMSGQK